MMAFELKKTEHVSLIEPLKHYITTHYGEKASSVSSDLSSLQKLREEILNLDIHQVCLHKLLKYYGQLVYIGSKFPINENNIQIFFSWYNSIGKDKYLCNFTSF